MANKERSVHFEVYTIFPFLWHYVYILGYGKGF